MDERVFQAIAANDKDTLMGLYEKNESILELTIPKTGDTALHLASRFGHVELVSEIVKLCPAMVVAENKKLESPLHEACRQGNAVVLMLLLHTNPCVAYKLNCENSHKSTLFMACSKGHLNVVKILLNQPWFLGDEADLSLHVATLRGHTDIVRMILQARPDFAQKIDKNGFSPLHSACCRGHLKMTKMLLKVDPDLALAYDNNGYTPLHLVVMHGKAEILENFMSMAPNSFQSLTKEGETVFHLAVRYNQYDAFLWLVQAFNDTNLFNRLDPYGNTILHLAMSGKCYQIAEYLINETTVEVNSRNHKGLTALHILDKARASLENLHLKAMLNRDSGSRGTEVFSFPLEIEGTNPQPVARQSTPQSDVHDEEHGVLIKYQQTLLRKLVTERSLASNETNSRVDSFDRLDGNPSESGSLSKKKKQYSPKDLRRHKRLSHKQREQLNIHYNSHHKQQHELHTEALQNARNTITLVAILIATVTFTAGTNPPGGVYQEGPHRGKSTVGRTTAFKVFAISNQVALFTSLSIVIVLVSIIPFRRKPRMRLLVVAHKVMWVAVSFMATAYVAATWVIMPHVSGTKWIFEALVSISGGTLGLIFIGLGVILVKHWLRKLKWRKEKLEREEGAATKGRSFSSNSDVQSAHLQGYHSY